ncbi:MAG TPA: GNAT family N-acetyltransferase [Microlunatus sp.]
MSGSITKARVGAATQRPVVSPAPRAAWGAVLDSDPGATALQTPDYLEAVLAGTGGRDASRLYLLPDGRRLVLPLVQQRLLPGLSLLADFPGGFGHGSVLATGGLRASDVRHVVRDLRGRAVSTRLGGGHHTAEQWRAGLTRGASAEPRRVDVIDLSPGWEQVYEGGFSRSARYNVRKAERAGVEVECDATGRLISVFYRLYLDWVERWVPRSGLPASVARYSALRQEPRRKFDAVAAALGDKCRVFVAWHQGRPVASCITLVHSQHAIGWRSYSIKELAAPVCANNLVQARALADAAASGCQFFDLGQSGETASLLSYKRSLGATAREVIDLRVEGPSVALLRRVGSSTQQRVVHALSRSDRVTPIDAGGPRR